MCALHYPLHKDAAEILVQSCQRSEATFKICWILKKLYDQDEDAACTRTFLSFFQGSKKNLPILNFFTNLTEFSVIHHIIWFKGLMWVAFSVRLSENFFLLIDIPFRPLISVSLFLILKFSLFLSKNKKRNWIPLMDELFRFWYRSTKLFNSLRRRTKPLSPFGWFLNSVFTRGLLHIRT